MGADVSIGVQVTVWSLALGKMSEATVPVDMLDDSERQRACSFRHAEDRHAYAWSHCLVRLLLAQAYGRPPAWWRFIRPFGRKPEVYAPPEGTDPRFSLTHTRDYVAVALANGQEVGIDAEWLGRTGLEDDGLTSHVCTQAEQRLLTPLEGTDAWRQTFLRTWVRKEAVAKALGLGLTLPFDQFDVLTDRPCLPAGLPGNRMPIQLWQLAAGADHIMAAAVQTCAQVQIEHWAMEWDDPLIRPA